MNMHDAARFADAGTDVAGPRPRFLRGQGASQRDEH